LRLVARKLIDSADQTQEQFRLLIGMPGIAEISALQILGELVLLTPDLKARQWVARSGLDPVAGGPVILFHSRFSLDELCPIQAAHFAAWVGKHDLSTTFNLTPSGNWYPRPNTIHSDSISTLPLTPVASRSGSR
jgi:hypothetical protein